MSIIDIIFGIIIVMFVAYGLVFGFVHKLGKIFALAIGTVVATQLYHLIFDYVQNFDQGYHNIAKALVFLILFAIGSKLALMIFNLFKKMFGFISFLPFLPFLNRIAGAMLGLLISTAIIVFGIYLSARYHIGDDWIASQLDSSFLIIYIIELKNIIMPFLPDTFGQFMAIFD